MMFTRRSTRLALSAGAFGLVGALALAGCASGDDGSGGSGGSDGPVTLNLAFWGNDVRAEMYDAAIAAFNEEHPDIEVNSSFLGFPEFWERRQVEATSGNLPDVMQFDYSYLRQYSENGLLYELDEYLGETIDTSGMTEEVLQTGQLEGTTYAVPIGTNVWSMFQNQVELDEYGVEAFEGGTWQEYGEWMADASSAAESAGVEGWGGTDWTGRIQNFELQLRAEGGQLFDENGEPGFTQERLAEFFASAEEFRDSGAVVPGQRLEELYPLSAFDAGVAASELTWDNFGAGYVGNLGEENADLSLHAPPVTEEGAQDLYLKPSMLHAVGANTEHPEEAALLVDFLINSPAAGEAFGTNRGLPASELQREGVELGELDQAIQDYQASVADRIGAPPAPPIEGFGSVEEEFRQIGIEIALGTLSAEDAAERFFRELENLI